MSRSLANLKGLEGCTVYKAATSYIKPNSSVAATHFERKVFKMRIQDMASMLSKVKAHVHRGAPEDIDFNYAETWCKALAGYSTEDIIKGFNQVIEFSNFWPTLHEFKRILKGTPFTDEEIGQATVARIEKAITKFGYNNIEDAKAFLGPIGWKTVGDLGGWLAVCSITYDQLVSATKKMRDLATINSKMVFQNKQLYDPNKLLNGVEDGSPLRKAIDVATGSNQRDENTLGNTQALPENKKPQNRDLVGKLNSIKKGDL